MHMPIKIVVLAILNPLSLVQSQDLAALSPFPFHIGTFSLSATCLTLPLA